MYSKIVFSLHSCPSNIRAFVVYIKNKETSATAMIAMAFTYVSLFRKVKTIYTKEVWVASTTKIR